MRQVVGLEPTAELLRGVALALLTTHTTASAAPQTAQMTQSKPNDVGCVIISIPYQINGGTPGTTTYYFRRPNNIKPEFLNDDQLRECGLVQRLGMIKGTYPYARWLNLVQKQLAAPQPDPWKPTLRIEPTIQGPPPSMH